jgi:xylulokinase
MQAVADATGVVVQTVATSEGAALGAAYLSRMALGLEASLDGARRWARHGTTYDPDERWSKFASNRYETFLALHEEVRGEAS